MNVKIVSRRSKKSNCLKGIDTPAARDVKFTHNGGMVMKKKIVVLLIAALLASLISFPAAAEETVTEFEEYGSTLIVLWDWVRIDDGKAIDPTTFLEDYGAAGGPAGTVAVRGWAATNEDIAAFGYMIDGGEPVIKEEYKVTTEDAVIAAATAAGCSCASRYQVNVDVSEITGNHQIDFLIKFEDGTIVKMITNTFVPVSLEYSADGSSVKTTPEPTAEPDPSLLDNAPGPILRLDDEELYADFLGQLRNQIADAYIDEDLGCAIISMEKVGDPWIVLMFSKVTEDDEPIEIDTDVYKVVQFGVRINPATGDRGQFYFQTSDNPGFDEAKDIVFDYEKTDERQYVNINAGKNKRWTGTVADCRIDPFSACSEPCDFELYYIAFFTNEKAASDFGDKWLEEGNAAFPTATPAPTKKPTAEPTATPAPTEKPTAAPATDNPENTGNTETAAPATEKATDGNTDPGSGKKGVNTGLVIGIVAGVVVAAAAVCSVIISKKKKG